MLSELKIDQAVELAPILTGEVDLLPVQTRYSLRVKPKERCAFIEASNIDLPAQIGKMSVQYDRVVLCIGPDEYILICSLAEREPLARKFEELMGKYIFSATDISHRNVSFILSGEQTTNMINVGCPLDLSLENFPVGKCTRTIFESAEIILFRMGKTKFQLETWRSFAPFIVGYFEKYCLQNRGK